MTLKITAFVKKTYDPDMVGVLKACQKANVPVPDEVFQSLGIDDEDDFDEDFGSEITISCATQEIYLGSRSSIATIDIDIEKLKKFYSEIHRIRCQVKY